VLRIEKMLPIQLYKEAKPRQSSAAFRTEWYWFTRASTQIGYTLSE